MTQKNRSIGVAKSEAVQEESALVRDLLSNVNDKCAQQIRIFLRANEKAQRGHLADMWTQGKVVETLRAKEYRTPKTGEILVNIPAVLSQLTDCSESYLNKMAQFFRLFPNEEEKSRVVNLRLKNGKPVIYAHWEQLIKFAPEKPEDSRDQLDAMVAKTVENSWSPNDLAEHIKMSRAATGKETRGGGRPTIVPPTFHGRLAKILKQTSIMMKNVEEIYKHPQYNLYEAVKEMSQEEISKDADNMMAGMRTLCENLRNLADWCEETLDDSIPDVLNHIQKCACSHAESSGKDSAAAIEEEDAA